ncbi:MAG TPA: hypothetical protein VN476_09395 [Pyrinomonadaceae bacterium]|jgi:hypothetical protein|nr:hypothetical protein [Pyrinomonadaceae bacterium]
MRKGKYMLMAPATLFATFLVMCSAQGQTVREKPDSVSFFDVLDLPARIDEPKLSRGKDKYLLNCAIANRSGEQLLGLRLILITVDSAGKLRTRVTWSEESELADYSIKTFQFSLSLKDKARTGDRYFLAIDEVIGSETIWRAVDSEKALRAYARGEHDVVPKVRMVTNKEDGNRQPMVIPLKMRKP